ncbi:uncharacterized protein N7469_009435 [Penicillium citrinum]|uniref:Uncharacterized protein n=2 Tax=Penicillium TaxID=5073 RepID=A0A9W9NNE9_PENCI|nr:uncharacterized protein N7469_009435 [Penicillium citrinum]KAJ5223195.1 hypothetical protein N7469_009435 [Penicillium citrinum]KAJ5581365.1 hypothetical protein N7450_007666 [Penicillium hetheringtonii]KAK5788073.1 hypothetical protein VI817_009031 [Penicillium citrinum]
MIGMGSGNRFVTAPRGFKKKNNDYEHALNEDPKTLQAWFATVQRVIDENRIQPEDIYNFDETGFAMGLIFAEGSYAS